MVVLALVAVGCRTEARVAVDVRADGSGTVTVTVVLDAEAAEQLGDPKAVALDDLRQAGWRVQGPAAADGGLRFVALRTFGSPAQLSAVLSEVGGADGVFRDVSLRIDDGTIDTSYRFRARLELTGDPAQFGDPDLTAALGGLPLGRTPEELAASGATATGAATLVVSVRLPGDAPETNGTVRGGRSQWRYDLAPGSPTSATLRADSSVTDTMTLVLFVAGALLLVAALVVLVVGLVRARRPVP